MTDRLDAHVKHLTTACLFLSTCLSAAPVQREGAWRFENPVGAVVFDAATGALRAEAGGKVLWQSGPAGLWSASFQDNATVNAADAKATVTAAGDGMKIAYQHARLNVVVIASPTEGGVELGAEVTAVQGTVLGLGLPGRLVFDPQQVARVIMPDSGTESVGTAYAGQYFMRQDDDHPSGWTHGANSGPAGYVSLYGGPLAQGPDSPEFVTLQPTEQAAEWLPQALRDQLGKAKSQVNRPPAPGQWDINLVNSSDGPWLSGKKTGPGYLWRIGAKVGDQDGPLAVQSVKSVILHQLAAAPIDRRKVGLLKLPNGPQTGGWTTVEINDWATSLRNLPGAEYVELRNAKELLAALASGNFAAVVNPYGEGCVAPAEGGMAATVAAIKAYTQAGGNWFETAGYPFYYVLEPVRYFQDSIPYPPCFADFQALEAEGSTAVVYRASLPSQPWDRSDLFTPGRLAFGGDEAGGWCERPFACWVPAGQSWRTPAVRVKVGGAVPQHLADYAVANGMTKKLAEKMKPEVWDKFRQAVMVKVDGPARDKTAYLDKLPVPTVVHFSDYLKGGFDKEYPDHLPPHPNFGTPAEFKEFLATAKAAGHLTMPYTNPTWWCDEPKGPTFENYGDEPLLKQLNGKLSPERYGTPGNTGFSITLWHPAVQEANRKTRTEFLEDYPIDILFQDQCGARAWRWDTNPASPNPAAYADGMISMCDEDAALVPLSTEGGWDGIVNAEAQLCGLSWDIVPTEHGPSYRTLRKHKVPGDLWTVYPVTQYLAQDKCSFIYHDLGQFVTNREVLAWTLGLGFNMTYRCRATDLANPAVQDWIGWLDVLQKQVCSGYLGGTLRDWQHTRRIGDHPYDVIRSDFGGVSIVANLDSQPVEVEGLNLAGYGFHAVSATMVAGNLQSIEGEPAAGPDGVQFVCTAGPQAGELWVYDRPESTVTVRLHGETEGKVSVAFDGAPAQVVDAGRQITVQLPPAKDQQPLTQPPANLAGRAPQSWPGGAPSIGVLDIPGMGLSWTSVTSEQWRDGLAQVGLPVKSLTSQAAVADALKAGPTRWLAIVNPYGEGFPIVNVKQPEAMLQAIGDYVKHGGSWVETGGYTFYSGVAPDGRASMGTRGIQTLGLDVGDGPVEALAEGLRLTATGQEWFGAEFDVASLLPAMVNRGLPSTRRSKPDVALLEGDSNVFFGGYRLGGWGYLWRLGGFNPPPETAIAAVAGALRHLATTPPQPATPSGPVRLFHAKVTPAG